MISAVDTPLSINTLAGAHKAAGDPLRLGILKLLGQGAFGVLELCQIFATKQSGMSHHLKVLAEAGLVNKQREGNSIFYRRPLLTHNSPANIWLKQMFTIIDAAEPLIEVDKAVNRIMSERSKSCEEFFAKHADDFREQQDLIASYEDYGQELKKLLDSLSVKGKALEIGPGEGAFLEELADKFEKVTGIDISQDMLALAKNFCQQQALDNVSLLQTDTASLLEKEQNQQEYDFAVANMVLHHVPAPKAIFADAGQLLSAKGTLLITDLCHHEQDWVRESCGDLWLGFEPEDLSQWAKESGFSEGQSQYLGLRNGFQIQFRLFHRQEYDGV